MAISFIVPKQFFFCNRVSAKRFAPETLVLEQSQLGALRHELADTFPSNADLPGNRSQGTFSLKKAKNLSQLFNAHYLVRP
jgi:hypothetical protein